jgi:hypothetical protein
MSAAAMANWAAGSSGVGPGVKRRVLRIIFPSLWSSSVEWHSQNTQFCDFCDFISVEIGFNAQIWKNLARFAAKFPKSLHFLFG